MIAAAGSTYAAFVLAAFVLGALAYRSLRAGRNRRVETEASAEPRAAGSVGRPGLGERELAEDARSLRGAGPATTPQGKHGALFEHPDLDALLSSLPLGVAVLAGGRVLYANELPSRALGAQPDVELLGGLIRTAAKRAASDGPQSRMAEIFGPPTRTYFIEAVTLPISPSAEADLRAVTGFGNGVAGEPRTVLVTVRDITEVVKQETARKDFVSNISHELRTPVGAISLLAETMSESDDPEVSLRFAKRISSEIERMQSTINDLLELAEIESRKVQRTDPVDLGTVCEAAISRLRSAASLAEVGIRLLVDGGPPLVAWDDPQLESVVYKLVDNSIKYSEAKNSVQVRLDQVRNDAGERLVRVEVSDSGIGIPRTDLDRIFERFFRVDRARSRGTGGTGLGLSIVRNAVVAHGGTVRAESVEGHGSTFTVLLPTWVLGQGTEVVDAGEVR